MAPTKSKKDISRQSVIPVAARRPIRGGKITINVDQNIDEKQQQQPQQPQQPPQLQQQQQPQPQQKQNQQNNVIIGGYKRKADRSPLKNEKVKRCALSNLTNADHIVNGIIGGGGINGVAAGAGGGLNKRNKITKIKRNNKVGVIQSTSITTTNLNTFPSKTTTKQDENKETQTVHTFLHPQNVFNSFVVSGAGSGAPTEKRPTKIMTRAAARATTASKINKASKVNNANSSKHNVNVKNATKKVSKNASIRTTAVKPKDSNQNEKVTKFSTTRRISNEFEKPVPDDSLYASALDELPAYRLSLNSNSSSGNTPKSLNEAEAILVSDDKPNNNNSNSETSASNNSNSSAYDSTSNTLIEDNQLQLLKPSTEDDINLPDGVVDFDKENFDDVFQVSNYALDIFNYLKKREAVFVISDYMSQQIHLNKWMRTLLVDWMVEVQETFELNHETLYLSVKLVDSYLCHIQIDKEKLQLVGAAALFICSKFEERTPPPIEDYIYICDGAYSRKELITTERSILKTIGFDLGIPISYRFLRRYARCAKVQMQCLTLARYILELSLMEYDIISLKDSQMACAALFMALRMNGKTDAWDATLQYYSGYELEDFVHILPIFNATLHQKPREPVNTIRNKYSHRIFYEVTKIPLLSNEELLEGTDILSRIK